MRHRHMSTVYMLGTLVLCFNESAFAQKYDELCKTPPMGWNSWNRFGEDIDEQLIIEIADDMVTSGMRDAGYIYLVVDEGWIGDSRDDNGFLQEDRSKFPRAMAYLADYVHSKGLKFGIHLSPGDSTCGGYLGSEGFEEQDAELLASWEVDYLKYDACGNSAWKSEKEKIEMMSKMGHYLKESERPIVFSANTRTYHRSGQLFHDILHLWRTTSDILPIWKESNSRNPPFLRGTRRGILDVIEFNEPLYRHARPGRWNDPDMLQVGNGELMLAENRTHFSLWCMMAAPLMAGNNLRVMSEAIREILINRHAIAIDQDPLGKQGRIIVRYGYLQIWQKELEDGIALCFFNTGETETEINSTWGTLDIAEGFSAFDIWANTNVGKIHSDSKISYKIKPHDCVLLKLTRI